MNEQKNSQLCVKFINQILNININNNLKKIQFTTFYKHQMHKQFIIRPH